MYSNITRQRILGYYLVGEVRFIAKVEAMFYAQATNQEITWHFNDDVFSGIDWTIPIEKDLKELYRIRAQQLRDNYDYVSIFFSGGVDSGNVLHSFIDNNIHVDEIVMYYPKKLESNANTVDLSCNNSYSEIVFAAIPHLKDIQNKIPSTKIRILDMCEPTRIMLLDDHITSQFYTSTPNMYSRSMGRLALQLYDTEWLSLYESGKKVCHIQGVDKPLIKIEKGKYVFQFKDSMVYNFQPRFSTEKSDMIEKQAHHELFYWTPDLPELVIKQCQVVKKKCQHDLIFRMLMANSDRFGQQYFSALHDLIYPRHVVSIAERFAVEKDGWGNTIEHWDWVNRSLDSTQKFHYTSVYETIRQELNDRWFMGLRVITPMTH